MIIERSFNEQERQGLSWEQIWKADDRGIIKCWEVGRRLRRQQPKLAERAERGELPRLGWKGGLQDLEDGKAYKAKKKTGTLWFLAQLQGLKGEDLSIDLNGEPSLMCSEYGVEVTFTLDPEKYKSAR